GSNSESAIKVHANHLPIACVFACASDMLQTLVFGTYAVKCGHSHVLLIYLISRNPRAVTPQPQDCAMILELANQLVSQIGHQGNRQAHEFGLVVRVERIVNAQDYPRRKEVDVRRANLGMLLLTNDLAQGFEFVCCIWHVVSLWVCRGV